MRLYIPMGIGVLGVVDLGTGGLNLLEAPLRQIDISSAQPTVQFDMA